MERKVEPVVCSCDQRKVIESVSNRKKNVDRGVSRACDQCVRIKCGNVKCWSKCHDGM